MTSNEIENEISKLNSKKACIKNDILPKMLINCRDIVSSYLTNINNNSKKEHKYPTSLKVADVTPLHKKNGKCLPRFFHISIHFCPLIFLDIGKDIVRNNA